MLRALSGTSSGGGWFASAGTAIMAFLPEDEQEQLLAHWAEHAGPFAEAHTAEAVRASLAMTREPGYSVNPGLVLERRWGRGAAVVDPGGLADWATRTEHTYHGELTVTPAEEGATVEVSLRYRLAPSDELEQNEFGQAILAIDGTAVEPPDRFGGCVAHGAALGGLELQHPGRGPRTPGLHGVLGHLINSRGHIV